MSEEDLSVVEYVEQVAMLLDLQLQPEYRIGVVDNFSTIKAIASLVNEFSLQDNLADAEEIDRAIASRKDPGRFAGVPFAVKFI